MFNLQSVLWTLDTYRPQPDKPIRYWHTDISEHLPVCAAYDLTARLCKYTRTYAIVLFEDEELISAYKQIDRKMFEDDPHFYLRAADEQFTEKVEAMFGPDEYDGDYGYLDY